MRRPTSVLALVTALYLPGTLAGQSTSLVPDLFTIEPGHSSVLFTARFLKMVHVPGRFTRFRGAIVYDSVNPGRSAVSARIQVASLNTDLEMRDKHLKSADFLDAEQYPAITFKSTWVERDGDGFVATGDLSMHGVTRTVKIPFTQVLPRRVTPEGNLEIGFVGQVTLSRLDFGIAGGNQFNPGFDMKRVGVGDSIDVVLNVYAMRLDVAKWPFKNDPKPSIGAAMDSIVRARGAAVAVAQYRNLKAGAADAYNFGANDLNLLGYKLLQAGRVADAITILTLQVEEHPGDGNGYDSLAEAYAASGDRVRAVQYYRKALELDPTNTNADVMLRLLN